VVSKVLIMNEFSKAKLDMTFSVPMELLLRTSHGGEEASLTGPMVLLSRWETLQKIDNTRIELFNCINF